MISEKVLSTELHVTDDFLLYSSGVFTTDQCANNSQPNSALLIVGYGITYSIDYLAYWTLQNSWGSNWGEGGAIRFARNRQNMCGIASHVGGPELI